MNTRTNPFYIKNIKIKSLFGTQNINWDVFSDVNILGGTNGSGKSTIIKAVYTILKAGFIIDAKLAQLISQIVITFSNGYIIDWNKRETEQKESLPDKDEEGYEISANTCTISTDGKIEYQRIKVTDSNGIHVSFRTILKEMNVSLINSFEQRIKYHDELMRVDKNDRTYLDYLIHDEIFIRNSVFTGIFEKLLTAASKRTHQEMIEVLNQKEVRNFLSLYDALELFMSDYDVPLDNQIRFKRKSGHTEVSYTELSMGEKQLVLLLLMVNNTAGNPCIFFMDEPDLGMHVEWKQKLILNMRKMNPNMQIILSTHAPSMIEGWYEKVKEMNQIIQ
ncbi:MAG: ATP-binding protein [Bacteroides sp.]|nr:ATP-binding protein [Bacteroides sp.]